VVEDSGHDRGGWADHAARTSESPLELADEPLEELDVLALFFGEVKESLHAAVVGTAARPDVVEHRRHDVFLDQAEHGEVGEAPDLVQLQLLRFAQAPDLRDPRQSIRKKGAAIVEGAPLDDVLELPVDTFRGLQDRTVVVIVTQHGLLPPW
jgi:hypothetical protein